MGLAYGGVVLNEVNNNINIKQSDKEVELKQNCSKK